jgi:hypothetical protein
MMLGTWGVLAHRRRRIGGLGSWRRRGSVGHSCILGLHRRRRVRWAHGLRIVSHRSWLAGAHRLRRIRDAWWIRILEACARRHRCRCWVPRGRGLGGWCCRVCEVVPGRRILDIAGLSVGDARRWGGCRRGMCERRRLRGVWALLGRKIAVVAHSDRLARCWSGRHVLVCFSLQPMSPGHLQASCTHVAYC